MARRATLAWTVIAIFFTFAISLPLNHVCIGDDSASPAPGPTTLPSTASAALTQVSQARPPVQKDDTCAACLWSNTLLVPQERVELPVAPAVTPMAPTASRLPLVSADLYQSPSKRGPPRRTIL